MIIYYKRRSIIQGYFLLIFILGFAIRLAAQVPEREIWQIQGGADRSPYHGMVVRAPENIVTAVGEQFFYMQTPPARSDQDPRTSDGLLVYTGFSPGVRPGDLVTVSGLVQEWDGQTRFGSAGLSLTLVNTQQPLPDPVVIDDRFPGSSPKDIPDLEQIEGMLVQISGITTGPSNLNGWFPLRGGAQRSFREPGIPFPGLNGFPVWDGNPEVFWMDPDGVGAPDNRLVIGGTRLSATAVLGQNYNGYLAMPLDYELSAPLPPRPVRDSREDEITAASLNALQLIYGTAGYIDRVRKLARYIDHYMRLPDMIALQEVGSKRVLDDLAVQLELLSPEKKYDSYLISGEDDIQTGFLVDETIRVRRVEQWGAEERLSIGGRLHDRPPLLLEVEVGDAAAPVVLRVVNLHLRSLRGIEGEDANFVRIKRWEQALSVSRMVQAWRDENLILLGDLNAFEFTDGYVDVVNQIQGTASLGALFPVQNIVRPPLQNLTVDFLPPHERYSYVFAGNAQLLDHCLRNDFQGLAVRELAFVRANADHPEVLFEDLQGMERVSDHDGFVLFLSTDTTVPVAGPTAFLSEARMPNPIAGGQTIEFSLDRSVDYTLTVLNSLGRILYTTRGEGDYVHFTWPEKLTPGWYAIQLRTEQGQRCWKMLGQ